MRLINFTFCHLISAVPGAPEQAHRLIFDALQYTFILKPEERAMLNAKCNTSNPDVSSTVERMLLYQHRYDLDFSQ